MNQPEIRLLSAVLRQWMLVLFFGVVGVGLALLVDARATPRYDTATELFIRFGNEYTVPATVSSSDRQQVDVDFDVAMNGEVQILTSMPVIEEALTAFPNPAYGGDALLALQAMSASHVANSPVLRLNVTDADPEWARNFSERLIDAYLERRYLLFRRNSNSEVIATRVQELAQELEDTTDRIQDLRRQISQVGTSTGTAATDGETVAGRIDRIQREIGLYETQEQALRSLLGDMRSQDAKLDLLAASMGNVQVLAPPRTAPQALGPGRTELMVLFGVAMALLAAAGVLLVAVTRGQRG